MDWLQYVPYIIAVLIGTTIFVLMRSKYKKQVSQILLYLVTEAEKEYGGNTGKLKFSAVSTWLYERLPYWGRLFLTEAMITSMIEDAVNAMKEYLKDNVEAQIYIEGDISE